MPRFPVRARVPEADVLRALACCVVVLIHIAVAATRFEASASPVLYALEPLYQLSLWATPVFAVLSGFVLRVAHPMAPERSEFWERRVPSIWVPLASWSAVYALLFSPPFGTLQYTAGFLLGQVGQGHLYFAAMVVQFYLLFPWLWKWIEHRHPLRVLAGCFVLSLAYQTVFSYVARPLGDGAFLWDASKSLLPGWLFYFMLGALAARFRDRLAAWCESRRPLAIAAGAVAAALLLTEYYLGPAPTHGFGSARPMVLLYGTLLLPLLWLVARRLAESRVYAPARALSARSYGIYLIHPLCLQLASTALPTESLGGRLLLFTVCTLAGTSALLYLAAQFAFGRRLVGLPASCAATAPVAGTPGLASATAG